MEEASCTGNSPCTLTTRPLPASPHTHSARAWAVVGELGVEGRAASGSFLDGVERQLGARRSRSPREGELTGFGVLRPVVFRVGGRAAETLLRTARFAVGGFEFAHWRTKEWRKAGSWIGCWKLRDGTGV
ncbi:hypothetical protein scyTo_0023486 [Scyliorhinus torazame]|uniref:Uncharacterized protein n=1 Tax=Scyliorhinus torazame TaxID=75743 RepID=A0A401QBQ4_SCYTO|nr:hypothetical protein [Scyliorhinus torazame]